MTREEAIEFLIATQNISPEHMMELLEALESHPAEPTYEQLKDYCRKRCLTILTYEAYETLVHRYNTQDAGHWIKSDDPIEKYHCSNCGGACWYYDYRGTVAKSNYCPNCGCRMEVES